ncbi:MAG: hypothetical protein ACLP50_32190 [Solirubrobacteraceae bacterium]
MAQGMIDTRYGGIFGPEKGKATAAEWLRFAKRRHKSYLDSLDEVSWRIAPGDELTYFRAFHAAYREEYPDMLDDDRAGLDTFLERAEKRLAKGRR